MGGVHGKPRRVRRGERVCTVVYQGVYTSPITAVSTGTATGTYLSLDAVARIDQEIRTAFQLSDTTQFYLLDHANVRCEVVTGLVEGERYRLVVHRQQSEYVLDRRVRRYTACQISRMSVDWLSDMNEQSLEVTWCGTWAVVPPYRHAFKTYDQPVQHKMCMTIAVDSPHVKLVDCSPRPIGNTVGVTDTQAVTPRLTADTNDTPDMTPPSAKTMQEFSTSHVVANATNEASWEIELNSKETVPRFPLESVSSISVLFKASFQCDGMSSKTVDNVVFKVRMSTWYRLYRRNMLDRRRFHLLHPLSWLNGDSRPEQTDQHEFAMSFHMPASMNNQRSTPNSKHIEQVRLVRNLTFEQHED